MLRYGPHLTGVRLPGQGHGPGQLAVSFDISPAWSAHRGLIGLWKLKELRFRGRGFKVGQAFPGTDPPRCYRSQEGRPMNPVGGLVCAASRPGLVPRRKPPAV